MVRHCWVGQHFSVVFNNISYSRPLLWCDSSSEHGLPLIVHAGTRAPRILQAYTCVCTCIYRLNDPLSRAHFRLTAPVVTLLREGNMLAVLLYSLNGYWPVHCFLLWRYKDVVKAAWSNGQSFTRCVDCSTPSMDQVRVLHGLWTQSLYEKNSLQGSGGDSWMAVQNSLTTVSNVHTMVHVEPLLWVVKTWAKAVQKQPSARPNGWNAQPAQKSLSRSSRCKVWIYLGTKPTVKPQPVSLQVMKHFVERQKPLPGVFLRNLLVERSIPAMPQHTGCVPAFFQGCCYWLPEDSRHFGSWFRQERLSEQTIKIIPGPSTHIWYYSSSESCLWIGGRARWSSFKLSSQVWEVPCSLVFTLLVGLNSNLSLGAEVYCRSVTYQTLRIPMFYAFCKPKFSMVLDRSAWASAKTSPSPI